MLNQFLDGLKTNARMALASPLEVLDLQYFRLQNTLIRARQLVAESIASERLFAEVMLKKPANVRNVSEKIRSVVSQFKSLEPAEQDEWIRRSRQVSELARTSLSQIEECVELFYVLKSISKSISAIDQSSVAAMVPLYSKAAESCLDEFKIAIRYIELSLSSYNENVISANAVHIESQRIKVDDDFFEQYIQSLVKAVRAHRAVRSYDSVQAKRMNQLLETHAAKYLRNAETWRRRIAYAASSGNDALVIAGERRALLAEKCAASIRGVMDSMDGVIGTPASE